MQCKGVGVNRGLSPDLFVSMPRLFPYFSLDAHTLTRLRSSLLLAALHTHPQDALEAAETATERLRASSLLAFSARVAGADEATTRLALREAFAHLRAVEGEEERRKQGEAEEAGFTRLPRAPRPEDEEEERGGGEGDEGEEGAGNGRTASSLAPKRRTVGRLVRAATRRRDEARVLHAAAEFLVAASLHGLAGRALALASEAVAEATAAAVDGSAGLPAAQALLEGRHALGEGDRDVAEAKLQEAVRLAPKRASAWDAAGTAAARYGDPDVAVDRLRRALDLYEAESGPDGPPCQLLLRLGGLYAERGETGAAKELFLRACGREPSATAWLGVGRACLQLGEVEEAEEALCEANALDSMVRSYRAMCLFLSPSQSLSPSLSLSLCAEP